jgi:beta-lactam-binding protein with PASTA domain
MNRTLLLALVVITQAFVVACAAPATLGRATLSGRDSPDALAQVSITRKNAPIPATPGMQLEKDDVIETGAEATLLLRFGGEEAVLFPSTRIAVLDPDPDLWMWFGDLWLHGLFKTKTEYVSAASEGTEYLVQLDRATHATTVTVIEGTVRFDSPRALWGSFLAEQGERVITKDGATPARARLTTAEFNDLLQRLNATRISSTLVVPDVRGLLVEPARTELGRQGLVIQEEQPMPVDAARVGRVVSQSPPPGGRANAVRLGVGAASIRVPSLLGTSPELAPNALSPLGLKLGNLSRRYTGSQKPGLICAQRPTAGTGVLSGSAVDVTVELEPVIVPALVDKPRAEVARLLAEHQLGLGRSRERLVEDTQDLLVLEQSPTAGLTVSPGTKVDIVVARAAVRVPDLHGKRRSDALRILSSAGLVGDGPIPEETPGTFAKVRVGPVVSDQSPEAGTLVVPGSTVTLRFATEPTTTAPTTTAPTD